MDVDVGILLYLPIVLSLSPSLTYSTYPSLTFSPLPSSLFQLHFGHLFSFFLFFIVFLH